MATVLTGWRGFKAYLEMIKIEHSIFALPFAMAGMVWGSVSATGSAWPGWRVFGLIVLAMVSCRSAAMAFNRIADRDIDAKNPRTAIRAIPAGLLSLRTANLYFYGSCLLFFVAAALLNPLAFALSPVALGITLVYSVTKRFTPLCHYILGLSLGIAPAAAWIAVTASLEWAIIPVFLGVAFWTAGFDIIYSLQDEEFDRENGLRSIPQTLGKPKALLVSRISHGVAIVLLAAGIFLLDGGVFSWAAVGLAAGLLAYEQSLVKPNDLSRVNLAFFTLNGFVSIGFFLLVLIDLVMAG
ncbi:UbiA-like polyprenyltransferase [Kamptonema cortianum]|nr:UbiA-like polyprenyltransferase [Geitlerinema splendidum]MDK3158582.1 UbiA-like polyprenyltransferase [Kamptonema cortianum]